MRSSGGSCCAGWCRKRPVRSPRLLRIRCFRMRAVHIRVEARDKSYQPMSNARVAGALDGPEGLSETIALTPQPLEEGVYTADYKAEKPGSYVAEITTDAGRDVLMFRREDGVAENFHTAQNKELLQKLSDQTGGHYYSGRRCAKTGWTTFRSPMPASPPARRWICGICRSCSCWPYVCVAPNGCCAENGEWYETGCVIGLRWPRRFGPPRFT